MKSEEAKNILQVYRPDSLEDQNDPIFKEALECLDTDPELAAWFAEQQDFDRKVTESLNSVEAPAGLKASILAGMHMHQKSASQSETSEPAPATTSPAWWQNPWIGIAAIFVVMFAFMAVPRESNPQLATNAPSNVAAGAPEIFHFLKDQIDQITMERFELIDTNPSKLNGYLNSVGAPASQLVSSKLADKESIGCLVIEHNGTKMSIICFSGKMTYHLITAIKSDFPISTTGEPQFFQADNQTFKVWNQGDKIQILSVQGTQNDLPELI